MSSGTDYQSARTIVKSRRKRKAKRTPATSTVRVLAVPYFTREFCTSCAECRAWTEAQP